MAYTMTDGTKIRGLGFNSMSVQDDGITDDGINFHWTGTFLILSNKAIPKDSQVYMELQVTSQPAQKDIRHIPLMLGVHKEPSFGIVNADCCLGGIYYCRTTYYVGMPNDSYISYRIIDKLYQGAMESTFMHDVETRVPIKKDILGIGVNMLANLITIFVEGKEFYSFSPKYFHMNKDESEFYFAIYCPEPLEHVEGILNFGRYGTKYLPDGFSSLYAQLYSKRYTNHEVTCRIQVGETGAHNSINKDIINGHMDMENDLAPIDPETNRRDLELIVSKESMIYYADYKETIVNKHAFQFSPNKDEWAYVNFPLDKLKKLYFEFHCSGATLVNNYLGIPISVGITKNKEDLSQASFKLDLYHLNVGGYTIITRLDGFEFVESNYNIVSPSTPVQPNTVGVLIDLFSNTIEIYTEGMLFTSIQSELIDFSKFEEPVWIFFEPGVEAFRGKGHVICNFGTKNTTNLEYYDDVLKFEYLRDNVNTMDLWYYYNHNIRQLYYNPVLGRDCAFDCTIKTIAEKLPYSKIIYATLVVPETSNEWTPGLNKLWKSYNKISQEEEFNNMPDKSIFDLHKLIEEDKENNQR